MSAGVWRYSEPNQNGEGEGWFIAFLDSAGCLSVQSDFGDYSYRWNMGGMPAGPDGKPLGMREWVARHLARDPSYLLGKISSRSEFDAEGSCASVRRFILEERRARRFSSEEAADEWDHVHSYLEGARSGDAWIGATSIEEPWHLLASNKYPAQARTFVDRLFPRLVALVRADLEAPAAPIPTMPGAA